MKTKILSLIILSSLFITTAIFAQEGFYGLSQPSSFTIVGEDVPINKIPVDAYVKKYVEDKIAAWQQKGEFEKMEEYKNRVNEQNRDQMVKKYNDEAIDQMKKKFISNIKWNNLALSKYDADNETYLIQSTEFGDFAIPVPVADAPGFKQNFSSMQFKNQDFYIINNKLVLAKLDIVAPSEKIYTYDSKQSTTYSSNNITYNFKPIEVEVKQDNVVKNNSKIENKTTVVGSSDVDINIPVNTVTKTNTYVLIIGNEDYSSFQPGLSTEINVDYAINDAKIFREYCNKTLGIPEKNIKLLTNATLAPMNQGIAWLNSLAKVDNGNAELIFYYSGHGLPDETTKEAYLMPVDVSGNNVTQGIKVTDVYNKLNEFPTKKTTVFLDACFSGGARNQGLIAMKGVKIKPKENLINGNIVVFSSSTGEESSGVYREKQHGFFTYFLLKKLQETKGNITYKELADYIIQSVSKETTLGGKTQTPQLNGSPSIENTWSTWKFR